MVHEGGEGSKVSTWFMDDSLRLGNFLVKKFRISLNNRFFEVNQRLLLKIIVPRGHLCAIRRFGKHNLKFLKVKLTSHSNDFLFSYSERVGGVE